MLAPGLGSIHCGGWALTVGDVLRAGKPGQVPFPCCVFFGFDFCDIVVHPVASTPSSSAIPLPSSPSRPSSLAKREQKHPPNIYYEGRIRSPNPTWEPKWPKQSTTSPIERNTTKSPNSSTFPQKQKEIHPNNAQPLSKKNKMPSSNRKNASKASTRTDPAQRPAASDANASSK